MRFIYLALLLLVLLPSPVFAETAEKTIELEGKNDTPAALFVQSVLEKAYANLGYKIRYRRVPLARSFVEANNGRLDGLRARIGSVADKYPNLVKVPFNLLDFKVILMADRRVCGVCNLSQITHIVTSRGFKALEDYLADKPYKLNITKVTGTRQSLNMLVEGKVQAAIMPDINVPEEYFESNQHWIKQTLAILPDYHYVNKKHAELVPKLLEQFEDMQASGEMSALRKRYGVSEVYQEFDHNHLGIVKGIAGVWYDFTDTPNGTYWKILEQIFNADRTSFSHQVTNWKRAKQLFDDKKVDILVGAYEFEVKDNMLRSETHVDYEWPVSAYGKDLDKLKRQLAGELPASVCYPLGYDFTEWLPDTIKNYEVTDFIDCERLFTADRVDILMNYSIDLLPEVAEQYPSVEVMEARPLFIAFHDDDRGKQLKDIFEREFHRLIASGQLANYYPDKEQFERANIIVSTEKPWAPTPVK